MEPVVVSLPTRASSEAGIRVLFVEDSDDDARLLTLQLARRGLEVTHQRVDNAVDMQNALLEAEWDIVISDHAMPGFSARAALSILKATRRAIPFVVYSGRIPDDLAAEIVDDGATACITKGDVDRLVPVIRELHPAEPGRAMAALAKVTAGDYDRLTGLASRDGFMRLAPGVLAGCRPGEQGVVCYIDFARFRRVNETFGYATGDAILSQIGLRLARHAKSGFAARFGGDEFVILEGGFRCEEEIQAYVQRLSAELAAPYFHRDLELHLPSSIGAAVYPDGGRNLAELVLNAECALDRCKRLMGRDEYLFYFPEMKPPPGERMLLESALWKALRRDEFILYYQPCVELGTGRVTGVEALLRWNHPELGLLGPDRFIPLAQEAGLMGEIDAWVLREASRQSGAWRAAGVPEFSVAVNVSATEFAHPRLLGRTAMALRESGMAPEALEVEITESALLQDVGTTIATLQALRHMGVRIAIDDFGTGYSSLAYLKRFPVDILKIDRSFVQNIASDRGDAAIARTIVGLARSLHLTVHAEGVETTEQLELLSDLGCDRAQGYLYARPVPADELLPLIGRLQAEARANLRGLTIV